MNEQTKGRFLQLLTNTMAAYAKPLPEAGIIAAWIRELSPFPLVVIEQAINAYKAENGQFAPLPAAIAKICRTMDGRPSEEEAWAQSFVCISETETVVWTEEMRDAFFECRPLLETGDKVGARMAFKDAYARMVADARAAGRAAKWEVSLGFDKQKQVHVIKKAELAGLLPAPIVAGLLPNHSAEAQAMGACPEGLRRIKEMMADMEAKRAAEAEERMRAAERDRNAMQAAKNAIAAKVAAYQRGGHE
ncbi:hypothetical protein ACIPEN_22135 [Herbaspirillum chlorophenolicum]|uniref:Replicative helicase inhibitor G39P N-terminal domain-containing protein n=1 Tax=Herbaspirillum chlorophenolicum TaxID=211589 RepID=A0ABW8F5H1_9BURK